MEKTYSELWINPNIYVSTHNYYLIMKLHLHEHVRPRIDNNWMYLPPHIHAPYIATQSWDKLSHMCKIWCRMMCARLPISMRQSWIILKNQFIISESLIHE